jgi:eukaryotic-like serine/threonine-protein kinase
MALAPGTRVRRYVVSHLLGAGGMGEVYRAHDVELDRDVALKILPQTSDGADADLIRRFLQEAKATIALSHPNVAHVYDVGDENGLRFMAMEYVEGETLRERMNRSRFTLEESADVTMQIASALGSAHAAGIVHRDIKPENVMLRPDGYVKVLDFGLAKLTIRETSTAATSAMKTEPGMIMGTMHYMSPEQLRGAEVDSRSDIFSLGVVLYELATARRPFESSTPSGIIAAILTEEPQIPAGLPPELSTVIARALAKDPEQRFSSARDMAAALKRARHESTTRVRSGDVPTQVMSSATVRRRIPPRGLFIAAALVLLAALGIWLAIRERNLRNARALLPKVETLAESGRVFEAWDLAKSVQPLLGENARLARVIESISHPFTVRSTPAGARVFLQRVLAGGDLSPRELAGTTPLEKYAIPRGDFIVTIEKEGFAPLSRPVSATPIHVNEALIVEQPPRPMEVRLFQRNEVPAKMELVDGGPYRLTGRTFVSSNTVDLAPFFIDRYEVSNRDFEQFVRAGGYRRRELWKHPFVRDGKPVSFEEAAALFRDATGLPAPRSWAQGTFPEGRGDHPVTDITWYEAAAYAEFAGKKLPTIYQWDKAARNGVRSPFGLSFPWGVKRAGDVTRRANFGRSGPLAVDSLPSGMSAWGVYHLAGNVTEWLRNPKDEGYAAAGGNFDDPIYQFGFVGGYPGAFSSPQVGFRCVREVGAAAGDQGGFALSTRAKPPVHKSVSDAGFAALRRGYDYEQAPLNAKLVERIETSDWTREKVTIAGAGGKTAIVYLYLPKGARPPYQVIHYAPPGDVVMGIRPLPASVEIVLAGIIRGGRAAFAVVLEGFIERESRGERDWSAAAVIRMVTDMRRGLDYVTTRPDIDAKKVAFYGPSAGADIGVLVTALDSRYRAVAMTGAGMDPTNESTPPEINPVNFMPRIAAPKLMLHGRYDETNPLQSEAQPLFDLMRGEKQLLIFEGGHIAPFAWLTPRLAAFYDEKLGPVGQ